MKNNMISTKFKYFFDGFGQYVVFTTKKQCKEYLKMNPNINRIKDLKEIGIEEWHKISNHPRNQVFEIIDNVAVPMAIDPLSIENSEKVWWDANKKDWISLDEAVAKANCPNCADQASIAAPGETVLCKTHADEKHFAEMKEFFNDELERIWFKPHTPFCSMCGTDKFVVYVGVINTVNFVPMVWSFCGDCRDELTLKRNAAIATQERIGA